MSAEDHEETLTAEELAKLPRVEFSAEVEERCDRFTKFYDDNRVVIENRWINMTKQVRAELLARNWRSSGGTGMPQGHRPDLDELAPWRERKDKARRLCPPRNVNENYLRWPFFSQSDLSDAAEPFLQLLLSRAANHPKEFARLDDFWDNGNIATISMGFSEPQGPEVIQPLVRIKSGGLKITSSGVNSDQGDSIYGAIEITDTAEDFNRLKEAQLWSELISSQLMINQRRIYHFLEDMVNDIMAEQNEARFKVDQEHVETQWRPQVPDADSMNDEEFRQARDEYISVYRSIMPFTAMIAPMWDCATQIISRRIEIYEDRLRGLKAHPGYFMQYIEDLRQHSHHEVSYSGDRIHPFANLDDNQNNGRMWSIYLVRALHHATEGLDFWRAILLNLDSWQKASLAAEDDTDEDDPVLHIAYLVILYVTIYHRLRPAELKDTLACSPSIRNNFRNISDDEDRPVLMSGLPGYPSLPTNNAKAASLISLLRAMNEAAMDHYIALRGNVLAEEILITLQGRAGGSWMTNFGLEKAEEHHDATTIWALMQRYWQYHDLDAYTPHQMMDRLADYMKWDEQLRPSKTLLGVNVDDIVAKYMIPYPAARFDYPNIKASLKATKRKENTDKRRDSEARLKALWADLQPRLEEEGAISEYAAQILNSAIPTATGEDGSDVTPSEPPAIPQPEAPSTPPQGPPDPPQGSPHTPPGGTNPLVPAATGTPTQQLGGLGINSPPNRPPRVRTPERKTANDGVKKISPIRPARPDEDRPRRPAIDRRAREAAREAARQARARPPPVRVVVPAAPPAAVEYQRIPLSAKSYDLVSRVFVTTKEKNPGNVPWEDIISLFREIGFDFIRRGSRGALNVFQPTPHLTREQGITTPCSRDRPHSGRLSFIKTREFLRGNWGFGKYGWDIDKFYQR